LDLLVLFGTLIGFLLLGIPVAFAMGLASIVYIVLFGDNLNLAILAQSLTTGINNHPLLAIPLFFLAGELMNRGGVTRRIVDCFLSWAGHRRGGLGHAVVLSNIGIAGMSGSAVADAAMTGPVLIPSMVKAGYGRAYSGAIVASAAVIGPIIPPSIPMIIYGAMTDTSVARLFIAGAIPGLVIGLYLMICNHIVSTRRGYGGADRIPWGERWRMTLSAFPALLTPVIILGGMVGGVVTPTEAGLIAVLYALALGILYREFTWRSIWSLSGEVSVGVGSILLVVGAGASFGWILANLGVGPAVVSALLSISSDPFVLLLLVNLLLLILGCLMDPIAILLIFTPILAPLMTQIGVDLVQFGVMITLNLMIGLITPPVGYLLFISAAISKAKVDDIIKESWPFLVALLICLAMVTYWPGFALALPDFLMPR
jgi:tripartite ATP-independent transporter DctM subunit